jgi:hypothetical protein
MTKICTFQDKQGGLGLLTGSTVGTAELDTFWSMLERVNAEVMARRERMAARVRDELAAAGPPIRSEAMDARLGQPGAEVSVEYWDADGIPVTIDWQTSVPLHDAFLRVPAQDLLERPASLHYRQVLESILQAMAAILTSAGFTVRNSSDDYSPFRLEVLDVPETTPVWRPTMNE